VAARELNKILANKRNEEAAKRRPLVSITEPGSLSEGAPDRVGRDLGRLQARRPSYVSAANRVKASRAAPGISPAGL
jgi:hypothetical protein